MNYVLPPCHVLRVSCGPVSSALISRVTGSPVRPLVTALGPSESVDIGPFPRARTYRVDGAGSVQILPATTQPSPLVYLAADGAITVQDSQCIITKTSAGAFTLAAPATDDDGLEILLTSATGYAHTIETAALVCDGTTGGNKDLGTFDAYAGASVRLVAVAGLWHVVAANGVIFTTITPTPTPTPS